MIEVAIWMARWRPGRSKMTGTQVHCRSLHGRSARRPWRYVTNHYSDIILLYWLIHHLTTTSRDSVQHDEKISVNTIINALLFLDLRLVLCQIFSYDFRNIWYLPKIFLRKFQDCGPRSSSAVVLFAHVYTAHYLMSSVNFPGLFEGSLTLTAFVDLGLGPDSLITGKCLFQFFSHIFFCFQSLVNFARLSCPYLDFQSTLNSNCHILLIVMFKNMFYLHYVFFVALKHYFLFFVCVFWWPLLSTFNTCFACVLTV